MSSHGFSTKRLFKRLTKFSRTMFGIYSRKLVRVMVFVKRIISFFKKSRIDRSLQFKRLSANATKWSKTFKQFVGCCVVFDHFVGLALKGLTHVMPMFTIISMHSSNLQHFFILKLSENHSIPPENVRILKISWRF